METPKEEVENCVNQITNVSRTLSYPQGFDQCLLAASMLIEQAGDILAHHEAGNRVSELMLLSARVEALMIELPADQEPAVRMQYGGL